MKKVVIGYEIGTGKEITIPVLHMAVVGQTQQSGKTTTMEALIERSGLRAVTFITKRAEGAFENAHRIPAYFRERADWEFVSALLEATVKEKLKFERSWIMRVCKGAKTLSDVRENVRTAFSEARRGIDESVYLTLQEYLDKLVPQIQALPYTTSVVLQPGVNAIDISAYSSELQSLVIRSVMEWIYERERNTIVLVPEAWEFVPQKRNSPVKLAAITLIRKGAAAGNYVWLDSQDIAGVDKEIIKQVSVWILGVQREVNEVKRTLDHLPPGNSRPSVEEVMTLSRGEFFVSHGRELNCVYVQPTWLSAEKARRYAEQEMPAEFVAKPQTAEKRTRPRAGAIAKIEDVAHQVSRKNERKPEEAMPVVITHETLSHEVRDLALLIESVKLLGRNSSSESAIQAAMRHLRDYVKLLEAKPAQQPARAADTGAIVEEVLRRLQVSPEAIALRVNAEKPELNVTVQRKVIEVDGSTTRGRLAQLIAEGFFDSARVGLECGKEMMRRGAIGRTNDANMYKQLAALVEMGFLTKEGESSYQAVPGMKINIREVQVA